MNTNKMSFTAARKIVTGLGLNLRVTRGEFVVSIPGNLNRAADYFATDLEDAVSTARRMSVQPEREATMLNIAVGKLSAIRALIDRQAPRTRNLPTGALHDEEIIAAIRDVLDDGVECTDSEQKAGK